MNDIAVIVVVIVVGFSCDYIGCGGKYRNNISAVGFIRIFIEIGSILNRISSCNSYFIVVVVVVFVSGCIILILIVECICDGRYSRNNFAIKLFRGIGDGGGYRSGSLLLD